MIKKSKQIKSKKAIVQLLLERIPETRDSDRRLIVEFWKYEDPVLTKFGTAETLLQKIVEGEFSNPDDISRSRRLVQAEIPELRGYRDDKTAMAEEVRTNINRDVQ